MRPESLSGHLLVRLAAGDVAMFRFLLEAYENLALFTVLERRPALLKLVFAPESREDVITVLGAMAQSIPLAWEEWPWPQGRPPEITTARPRGIAP